MQLQRGTQFPRKISITFLLLPTFLLLLRQAFTRLSGGFFIGDYFADEILLDKDEWSTSQSVVMRGVLPISPVLNQSSFFTKAHKLTSDL